MSKSTSIYLNLLRIIACLFVFLSHASYERLGGEWLKKYANTGLGLDGVIIFFVLSGFVIRYVVNVKDKTFIEYSFSRISRLYSVVLPALFITLIFDFIGTNINHDLYQGWWNGSSYPHIRMAISCLFANEIWFLHVRPFTNGPFWSICYEFWFYVLFAFSFYTEKQKRLLFIVLIIFIIGPKILLLYPVWYLGVLAFNISSEKNIKIIYPKCLFVLSVFTFIMFKIFVNADDLLVIQNYFLSDTFTDLLGPSENFLYYYIVGLIFFFNILSVCKLELKFNQRLGDLIGYFASFTFTIYLLHYPSFHFFYAFTESSLFSIISTLILCFILGTLIERKGSFFRSKLELFLKCLFSRIFLLVTKNP